MGEDDSYWLWLAIDCSQHDRSTCWGSEMKDTKRTPSRRSLTTFINRMEQCGPEGLAKLLDTISRIKQALNERLTVAGAVLTMFDARTNLSRDVVAEVRENFPGRVFNAVVPRSVRLAEAPSHGTPISMHDPQGAGAKAYRQLAQELLAVEEVAR